LKPKQRKFLWAVAVIAICVFFAVRYFSRPARPEPVYHGKTLTRWLKQLDDGQAFGISSGTLPSPTPAQLEAADAIRAMGVAALPLLMEDVHARPAENSSRNQFYRWSTSHLPRALGLPFMFLDVTREDRTRWRAAQGLAALGPLAKPALPELKRLLYTNFWHSSIKEAAYALATIGPQGIEILTNAPSQNEWSGMCAIWALGQHPSVGTNVIPFLITATASSSEGTACGAIQVLGLFQADGEHVVPALTSALNSPNTAVRRDAAQALGHFGRQAASALPLLQSLTNDDAVRDAALKAIKKIQ
jgi:hypothetical protein